MTKYFVSGIGTGIGKTLISAILTEKLHADYWKPIQSGDLERSDSKAVASLISNNTTFIHPESYRLTQPLSPHLSARLDGISIEIDKMVLPETQNHLIVEGAGGLMVPLNDNDLIIDFIKKLKLEMILVSENYLGSINHTLLSLAMLKLYNIPVKGIIFNGKENEETQNYILNYTGISLLGVVPRMTHIDKQAIVTSGELIRL
ncbi:dethiobiotin synthetase [Pedobacter sp. UYP30]|uniref:dethiobiotin synthase n=1 Tax=Pedobacter sp. UYP30 TaxID=1756400 RepID=UPI00339B76E8